MKRLLIALCLLLLLAIPSPAQIGVRLGHKIADEGTLRPQRSTINFVGTGVSCVDDSGNDETDCTITSGGGGGALNDLSDVTITAPATGATIIKGATDWVDGPLDLADADARTGLLPTANVVGLSGVNTGDDDVPESGDFGAAAELGATGSVDAVHSGSAHHSVFVPAADPGADHSALAGGDGISEVGGVIATASGEDNFLVDGGVTSLTCGATNLGRMQVMDDGTLEYCDGATTSVLRVAATADGAGLITDFSNASELDAAGAVAATHSGSAHHSVFVPAANPTTDHSSNTVGNHSDTTATGDELETLTDGSNADGLHDHADLPLAGGVMTAEFTADDLGIEFAPGDALTNCTTFAATSGGIFYDDSEGRFKKCQDNVLTDLDTGGSEVNDLNAIATSAATNQIFVGSGPNAGAYIAIAECANDAKIEYTDGAPNTFTCEQISGLVDADVSDTLTSSLFVGSGSSTTAVDLATSEASGTLPVAKGGTGVTASTGTGSVVLNGGPTLTGIVKLPFAATPVTAADGEMSIDLDALGTGRDAIEVFDGTASTYVAAFLASDTPANGEVLKFNTGGTITWELDSTGGTPALTDVTPAVGDALFPFDLDEEVSWSYTGNFTAGNQFAIIQQTGNPTGGVLLDVRAADTNVTVAQLGDGTNGVTVSQAGALTIMGTGSIAATDFSAASDLNAGGTVNASHSGSAHHTAFAPNSDPGVDHSALSGGDGISEVGGVISTASGEDNFLVDGGATSLTCGVTNLGRAQVMDDGTFEYCDGATTSVLRTAALGDGAGLITDFSNAADLNGAGTVNASHSGSAHHVLPPLNDLTDVTITTPATGAVMIKSAGDWIDGQLDLADADARTGILPDANIASTIARDSETEAKTYCHDEACSVGSDDDIVFEEQGAADPITDGNVEWDTTTETLKIGDDGAATHEFYPVDAFVANNFCTGDATLNNIDCDQAGALNDDSLGDDLISALSGITGNFADDEILVGTGADAAGLTATIKNCTDATQKLDWNGTDFVCIADADSGGATAINDLGDAGGVGAVALAELAQTWTWDTAATAGAFDGLTLSVVHDSLTADATAQRGLRVEVTNDTGNAIGAVEALLSLENLDATAGDVVDDAIIIRSALGGITDAIDVNDADIVNIITHAGGSVTSTDLDIIDDGVIDVADIGTGAVDGDELVDDSVDTTELDDTEAPGTGQLVATDSATATRFEYLTAGTGLTVGADSLTLDSAAAGALGGIELDTDLGGTAAAPTVVSVQAGAVGAGDYVANSIDAGDVAAALDTHEVCIYIEDPVTAEQFETVWRAPTAVTAVEIYCEATGGTSVGFDFNVDDGSPAGINGSDIVCTTSGVTDSTFAGDTTLADGDRLDIDIGTVSGTVDAISFCLEYTID